MNSGFDKADPSGSLEAEYARLRGELSRSRMMVEVTRASLSFQVGNMLVRAALRPRPSVLLLPFRILRLGISAFRRRSSVSAPGNGDAKAVVLRAVRARLDEMRQEAGDLHTHVEVVPRKGLKIAVVMDRFTRGCLRYEAEMITFTPENWKAVLRRYQPHLLLVGLALQGTDSSWTEQTARPGERLHSELPGLVRWCNDRGIPTAFWNNENPIHYDEWLDVARLFDFVFTSDSDCIQRYRRDLRHDRVYWLPSAVQPRVHNPVNSSQKLRDVALAYSCYAGDSGGSETLRRQVSSIIVPALRYDADIYDWPGNSDDRKAKLPEQLQQYTVGRLSSHDMAYVYKIYRVFLTVCGLPDSSTFLPQAVLESLASGTCVISSYSRGIENNIGSDIVKMSSSPDYTRLCLKQVLMNDELRDRLAHLGLRKVMTNHTYRNRLEHLLKMVGLDRYAAEAETGVSVISCTNRLDSMESIFANYERQTYPSKELVVILNDNSLDMDRWAEEAAKHDNATVYRVDEREGLGTCLNLGVDKARFEYIAKFDDDDYYAPAYLDDLMIAFNYSGADIVGKDANYYYFEGRNILTLLRSGREHCYSHHVSGATMMMKRSVFGHVRFDSVKGSGCDTRFQKRCLQKGFRIYSSDRFNFCVVRRGSPMAHTWQITDDELLSASRVVCYTEDYVTHVTC